MDFRVLVADQSLTGEKVARALEPVVFQRGALRAITVDNGRASAMRDARQQVLSAAYAAHPERFVRKRPQPPILPHAVWINPPKEQSASQDRTGATISIADDPRVARNGEGIGAVSETVGVSPHTIMTSTDEVLH
jgi:hypothetical protein